MRTVKDDGFHRLLRHLRMIPIVPLKNRISNSSSAPVSKRGVFGVEGNSSVFFSLGDDIFGGVKMALPRVAARIL